MTREEHLAWAKKRAIEYADRGDVVNAMASITSDLNKHDETRDHPAIRLMGMLMLSGSLSTPTQVKDFIEGFN